MQTLAQNMNYQYHVSSQKKLSKRRIEMKAVIIAMLALAAFTGSALAADVIEMKKGVKFDHKAHQERLKVCSKCHATAEGGKHQKFLQRR